MGELEALARRQFTGGECGTHNGADAVAFRLVEDIDRVRALEEALHMNGVRLGVDEQWKKQE